MNKKEIRKNFNYEVFTRDKYKCKMCGKPAVDAHHIIDRHEIPNGGYVKENGISLCEHCHELAEHFHAFGEEYPGYSQDDLFNKIGSSREKAFEKSGALNGII